MTRVIFTVDEQLLARIDRMAKEVGLSRAALIRFVLSRWSVADEYPIHLIKPKP